MCSAATLFPGDPVEIMDCSLAVGGTFTLLADGKGNSETGRYSLHLQRLNNPGSITTLTFGQSIERAIEVAAEKDALPDRAEVFVRVVGPRPNGKLWPTLVKFSTSRIEVWTQQKAGGETRYYDLEPVPPGERIVPLAGLADKEGFDP